MVLLCLLKLLMMHILICFFRKPVCTVDASPEATVQWVLGPQGSTVAQTLTNVPYTQYDAKKILTRLQYAESFIARILYGM